MDRGLLSEVDGRQAVAMFTVAVASAASVWLVPSAMARFAPLAGGAAMMVACLMCARSRRLASDALVQRDAVQSSFQTSRDQARRIAPEARMALGAVMAQLEQAGSQLVGGIGDLAGTVRDQADAMGEVVAEGRRASDAFADLVLAGSQDVADVSVTARRHVEAVQVGIAGLVDQMAQSVAAHAALVEVAQDLQGQTEAIRQIARTVGDIARQSSMLALNATIEAARSGHDGRGFAVVAEEFRRLATETSHAAQSIGALVETVDTGIQTTTAAIAETNAMMVRHQQEAASVRESLEQVHSAMDCVSGGAAGLHDRAGEFAVVQTNLQGRLHGIAEQTDALQTTVYGLFENLQFSDICRQGLAHVATMLDDLEPAPAEGLPLVAARPHLTRPYPLIASA